jgi:hypothetical protein
MIAAAPVTAAGPLAQQDTAGAPQLEEIKHARHGQ